MFRSTEFSIPSSQRPRDLTGLRLAGFLRRAVALWIDLMLVALLATAVGLPSALSHRDPSGPLVVPFDPFHGGVSALLFLLYFALGTYFGRGQTLGKRLLRIRVVSLTHDQLSLWQCTERALGYAASALEAGFGFLQYFTHANHQTVHDRIAETVVLAADRDASGPRGVA